MSSLFFAITLALAQPTTNIRDVRVVGNDRVTDEAVRAHAAVTSEDEIPAGFRRLWDTGLFEDVRFELEDDVLVIHVDEKPTLATFRFEGAAVERVQEDELVRALELRRNQPFGETDRARVERAAQELVGEAVDVTATTEVEDGLVSLVIAFDPVELETIERILFVGNEAIDDGELRAAMRSQQKGWFSWLTRSDALRPAQLREDADRLQELYASRGYLDARVGPIEVGPVVAVPIFEGRQYRLDRVTVEPGPLLTEAAVADWLPEAGGVYDGSAIDAVVSRLERYYQSRGYPSVTVVRERTVTAPGRVAIHLRVDEGAFLRVGTITFRGNRRHRDRDLRQHLDFAESDRFDQALVERGVEAIRRLETIDDVVPEVDFTTRPGRADIVYNVREVDRFEYLVGGGLNGVQGGTGNGQLIAKSLLGRGDVWRLDLDLGNRFQNFVVGYRDPSTLGRRLFFSIDFARTELTFPDETSEDTLDFVARVGGPQGSRWQYLAGFRATRFTLGSRLDGFVPFLTPFVGQRFRTNRASFALAYESRNQPVFATRGSSAQMGFEVVTGDVEAVRARAQLTRLLRPSSRHLVALTGRAEAVWPFGATDVDGLPRFERLFLGSENDLRGFAIRGVGPRNEDIVVGGDRLAYASAEYQFLPHPRLRLVGFVDAGSVWATDFEGLALPEIRYDAGAELQWLTPIWNLPFRVGYGRNLDPVLDEDDGRFFVTFSVRF